MQASTARSRAIAFTVGQATLTERGGGGGGGVLLWTWPTAGTKAVARNIIIPSAIHCAEGARRGQVAAHKVIRPVIHADAAGWSLLDKITIPVLRLSSQERQVGADAP